MTMFSNAQNTVIHGGEFHNVNAQYTHTHHHSGQTGIDVVREASVPDAAVDADARRYEPICCPGTRDQYINDITDWATGIDSNQTQQILWMWGPAGVGKSALAQTCAENVKELGQLGAAFFFSINGRTNHRRFFITLVYQLSTVLCDYRQVLGTIVYNDKTLVTKTMASQFNSLIVQPLQEFERQGKTIRQKAILIDGLDECASTSAQVEIIRLLTESVRAKSTPFRWAFFSRAEPHIRSAFEDEHISAIIRIFELPIRSQDDDDEIELYLRTEFQNMLRRRNLPLSSLWPSDEDIKTLVKATAGLFAYAATVLRSIDLSTTLRLEDPLREVLTTISEGGSGPFMGLDVFYMLIMQRIPKDIFPTAQLFLILNVDITFEATRNTAYVCNLLGLSRSEFLGLYQYLHAVLKYQEHQEPLILSKNIDPTCSYFVQDHSFQSTSLTCRLYEVHAAVKFYHKSFYDFLKDPARSSSVCVTTPAIRKNLFDRLVERHHRFAHSREIQGAKPVLAHGVQSSSASLSWPQGSEFVDSYLKFYCFYIASCWLSHDGPDLVRFMEDVALCSLQKIRELDYRKSLIADLMVWSNGLFEDIEVLGLFGSVRVIDAASIRSLHSDRFRRFNPEEFLQMVKKFETLAVIKPHHPQLPSPLASITHAFSRRKPYGRCSGLYRLGHGKKLVVWYWEFDTKKRYFHEFKTVNLTEATKTYEKNKFEMWESSWEPLA